MDVTNSRVKDGVVILGSGTSMLDLKKDEIEKINQFKTVIAFNKYMAFYKKIGIIPTHVYFHDLYGFEVFLHILNVCKNDGLEKLTFFIHPYLAMVSYRKRSELILKILKDIFYYRSFSLGVIILRLGKNSGIHKFKLTRPLKYYKLPDCSKVKAIRITTWNKQGKWANSLNDRIFHFRGSLTSVLNIASIIAPEQEIMLVGNDFNGSKYFYEDELEELNIEWKDYTYSLVKKEGIHYSFQNVNGASLTDAMPYIVEQLNKNKNNLYCNNPSSLLVTNCGVQYKAINND